MIIKAILFGASLAIATASFFATLFIIAIAIGAIYGFTSALMDIFKR